MRRPKVSIEAWATTLQRGPAAFEPRLLDAVGLEGETAGHRFVMIVLFAQQLLATTDRAFRAVVSENWLAGMLRTQIIPRVAAFAMRRKRVQRAAFRTISQIGIHYRQSPLSRTLEGVNKKAPQAGDRFPWLRLQGSRAGCPGRSVRAHGRHALQSDRHRAACTIAASLGFDDICRCTQSPMTPRTIAHLPRRPSRSRRTISFVPTDTSASPAHNFRRPT